MSDTPITFEQFRENFPGVTPKRLRKLARLHGIGSQIGKKLFFVRSDVSAFMKATQCSQSISAAESGTVEALSPESESAEVWKQAIERSAARLANVTPQIALKHYVHAGEPSKLAHDVWQKMTQKRKRKLKTAEES